MKIDNLHSAFITKLRSLYDIERELTKALPKMSKKATDPELKKGFANHALETKTHLERLENAFELLGQKPKKKKSEAIRGLVADAEWVMKNAENSETRDAMMIAAAQYVEHYEIAGYGTAVTWAKLMKHTEVAGLLAETLKEEEMTDKKLNMVAKEKINKRANTGGME